MDYSINNYSLLKPLPNSKFNINKESVEHLKDAIKCQH